MGVLSTKIDREQLNPGDHIYSWRTAYIYAHHGIYIGDGKVIQFAKGSKPDHKLNQESDTSTLSIMDKNKYHVNMFNNSRQSTRSRTTPCPNCGFLKIDFGVISSCLDCFLWGGELHLFKYGVSAAFFLAIGRSGTCSLAASDAAEDVLYRAQYLLKTGEFGAYDLFRNNCEDFAVYCKTGLRGVMVTRTGVGISGQVVSLLAASGSLVFSLQLLLVSSAVGCLGGFVALGVGIYCVGRLNFDVGVRCDVTKVKVESLNVIDCGGDDFYI
ncbi:protein LEAD-SENSITIVE 1-like [Humulus lupulus]|uniref:protein LEAD-SENSITIVE 1-like n=1 Tax=Humulus lupulus TaxID=3486 RepID=UPI002B40E5EF|nr:protein LEAD-SENSITIVE 1-like [Humulus lupulus]